jgi:hypothetical protein
MKNKLYIFKPADRETVITILAMNGYTVRQGKEKNGKRTIYFVEYWKEKLSDA